MCQLWTKLDTEDSQTVSEGLISTYFLMWEETKNSENMTFGCGEKLGMSEDSTSCVGGSNKLKQAGLSRATLEIYSRNSPRISYNEI